MNRPIIRIHNQETNEIIDREMTDSEFVNYEANLEIELQRQEEITQTRQLKISAYQKLGLSESEIEALLPTPQPPIPRPI